MAICKLMPHVNDINAMKHLAYVLGQVHAVRKGGVKTSDLMPQFIDVSLLE